MRLFIVLFLVSFSALATSWGNLQVGRNYKLSQSFELTMTGRSAWMMYLMKDEVFHLRKVESLGSTVLYIFDYKNCPGPEMGTELEIVPVGGTSPVVKTGTQLEACELKVYIEMKDYYSNSLFE